MGMFDFNDSLLQPRVVSTHTIGGTSSTGGSVGVPPGWQLVNGRWKQLKNSDGSAAPTGDAALAGQLKGAFDAANKASQARLNKMLGLANQFGAAQNRQSQLQFQNDTGGLKQDLVNRGLGNTTIANTMQQGLVRQKFDRDQLTAQNKAGLQLGVYNNVQEQGPDMGLYAQLFGAPRAGGGGGSNLLSLLFGGK